MLKPLWFAILFLTRIPVPTAWQHFDESTQNRSIYWHPLVGLIIGFILFGFYQLLQLTGLSNFPTPTAALVTLLWILITGGLHLDGLGDSADGWLGGYGDKERTLTIMKDSHSGAAAIIAIASIVVLKISAVAAVLPLNAFWLIIMPLMARTCSLILFDTTSYARANGLGAPFSRGLHKKTTISIYALVFALLLVFFGAKGVTLCLGLLLLTLALRHLMLQRIHGVTGDTAGATIEITEAFGFVFILMLS